MEITVELLQELIEGKQIKKLREYFDEYNIVDLAEKVQLLSLTEVLFLFKVLRKDITAELFSYFDADQQKLLIEAFTGNEIQEILDNLFTDDITDMIEDLPSNLVNKILKAATLEQRSEINLLLSYPESSAGSIMSTDFVELKETDTIGQALKKIKRQGKIAETVNHCYVIDAARELVGIIPLKDVLFQNPEELIEEHMETAIVSVKTHDDQEEVAQVMRKYDLLVVPVVNDQERLIGIITIDDIMDIMEEEVTEDIQKMAAIRPTDESYLKTSVIKMTMSRIPWLLILMVSATITGMILTGFEEALAAIPALAAFVPMVMGTAGNAGGQASVMVIRGITVDGLNVKDTIKVILKESRISLMIGTILFIVSIVRIMILPPDVLIDVALVVSVSLVISVVIANILGGFLPLVALAFKQDPAAMAAPLITTLIDAFALLIYFVLCKQFLGI